MSIADKLFKKNCMEILANGYSNEGEDIRPRWEDGTPAYTKKIFGVVNEYDLGKEFPITTLRYTNWKAAIDELLWIWRDKSNRLEDLHSGIWDEWGGPDGTIGKAYGYQLGKTYIHHQFEGGDNDILGKSLASHVRDHNKYNSLQINYNITTDKFDVYMDQVDAVLYDLTHTPQSRRIMTNIYNFDDLHAMNLYPCAYSTTWNVTGDKLNMILNQRSQDTLMANNWNVVQYSVLVYMMAQVCGFKPGKLVHVISDMHIYDKHLDIVRELCEREEYPAPKLVINPNVTNFYDFTVDDFEVVDYKYGKSVGKIPIAI